MVMDMPAEALNIDLIVEFAGGMVGFEGCMIVSIVAVIAAEVIVKASCDDVSAGAVIGVLPQTVIGVVSDCGEEVLADENGKMCVVVITTLGSTSMVSSPEVTVGFGLKARRCWPTAA